MWREQLGWRRLEESLDGNGTAVELTEEEIAAETALRDTMTAMLVAAAPSSRAPPYKKTATALATAAVLANGPTVSAASAGKAFGLLDGMADGLR